MKIRLPNGEKVELNEDVSISTKMKTVKNLLKKFDKEVYNNNNIDNKAVLYFLDGLANYLVWHKEPKDKNKEDKDVLSIEKVKKMIGKRASKSIPFTSLSKQQKELLFDEVGSVENEK